ncbi:MAG: GEVED domain-containing protein, partial [Bacteroidia bacterium]
MKKYFTLLYTLLLSIGGAQAQFCIPTYSTGPGVGDSLVSFQLGSINASFPGDASGYNDYTALAGGTTSLTAGQTYTATMVNNPTFGENYALYIDYNNDTIFDIATEKLGEVNIPGNQTGTITFTVPAGATQTTVRLRMVCDFTAGPVAPCVNTTWGETEDYHVVILPPSDDDVGVSAIEQIASPSGPCTSLGMVPITVEVSNFGNLAQTSVPMAYSINGGVPVPEIFTPTVLPMAGSVDTFTFTVLADLSAFNSTFNIQVWTDLAADTLPQNDTLSYTVVTPNLPAVTPANAYVEDFESFTPGFPGTFANGWTTTNTTTPRWQVTEGPGFDNNSTGTGPWFDNTLQGAIGGRYVFTESSGGTVGAIYDLVSPCIDLSGVTGPRLEFAYHMFGSAADMSYIVTQVLSNGVWATIDSIGGPQQTAGTDPWLIRNLGLGAYAGQVIQIRFLGNNPSTGFTGDAAIDDVKIFQPLPKDGGITDAFGIASACGISANETIQSIGRNFGTDTLFTLDVNYSINGVLGTAVTINDTIAPDSTFTIDFMGIDLSVPNTYDICVFTTNIAGDVNQLNDTTCFTVVNIPVLSTFPYLEDFESGNGGWTEDGTGGTWALGTPAKAVINSAASGVNAWVTGGLTGQYNNGDNSFILGPCFDFTTLVKPIIRLDVWWESEFSWDGMKVQTSIDAGLTWQDVGLVNDPNNWYNDATIAGLGYSGTQSGWTGRTGTGSNGWVSAEHELNGLGGQSSVLVRVAFGSDGSVQGEGTAFDNVEIFEAPPFDLAANRLVSPVSGCGLTDSSQVKLEYIHEGSQSVTGVVFGYSIDGATPILQTDTTTVNPGDTLCYLFTTFENLSVPDTYNVTVWVSAPGDTDNADDTLANLQVLHKIPISTFPYVETFDNPGGTLPVSWENVAEDGSQDWVFNSGGTFVFNSGPSVDHTTGTTNGFYALASDQFNNNSDSVILITPCFDVTALTSPKFGFWYHSNNANGANDPFENELHIDLIFNGTIIYDFIPPIVHKDNNWNLIELNMDQYIGVFAFRFRANNNNGAQVHDFAIDDINLVEVLPQDVGVTALIEPTDGCGLLATDTVIVEVTNIGTDSVKGGFDVSFQLGTGTITTISITDTILAGNTIQVPFFPVDLSTPGTYNVTSWTSGLAGDTNFGNDTLQEIIISEPSVGIPLSEDFETYSNGDVVFLDFFNDPNGDINWQVNSGGTGSTGTGPSAAHSGTNYIYMETSGPAAGSEAILRSSCIDLAGVANPSLFYAYHMFGPLVGSLSVDVETASGTTNLSSIIGQQQLANADPWGLDTLDLSPWAGQVVRIIFTGVTNGSFTSDISIDAIDIRELVDNDISALSMLQPAGADCSSDSTVVEIEITNSGTQPQINVPVTVDYTGAITGSITTVVPGPIAPGAVVNVVVGTVNTLAGGTINFTGYSSLAGDTTNVNDTTFSMTMITVRPPAPTAVMDTIILCTPDSTIASVVNDTAFSYLWYTDAVGGTPIAFDTANFQTGFLSNDTTLYVEAVPGGDGALIKVTEAELQGPDYMEVMNTGLTPVDVTGWTVAFGEDGAAGINTVATSLWNMSGVMQPGEIRERNDAIGDPNYIGSNILWNGGQEGWVVILDAQNTVVDVLFFNYSDTDIMGFAPTINGTVIDITGKWNGPGVDVSAPVFAQNCYRIGTFDNNDASDWTTNATASFAGQGTLNPGLGPVVTGGGGGGACPSEPRTPITILVAPPVQLDLGPDAVTCAGFVVDASDPSIASYTWNTGDMTAAITVNTTGTYYVDVIDINGCTGTDTINLNILPSPIVDLGQDSLVSCGGVTLDAGNAGSSFLWSVAGQFQQTLQVTTTGTYWVEANLNGCIDTDTIYIEVLPAPSVSFGGTIAACNPFILDAGNPGSTYLWSTGATSQTINVTPPAAGGDTITVTVTNVEGCDVTEQVIITPGVDPVVDLGADLTDCDSVLLDAGNAGATYAWSTGETSQTIYATNDGNYTVTLIASNNCGSDTTTYVIGKVDIDDLFSQSLDVFPNPTTGNFYIKSAELQADNLTIEVFDAKGSLVYRKLVGRVNGVDEQVDLTNHPEGVYMVKISDGTR